MKPANIPFRPEPIEEMRARFNDAIADLIRAGDDERVREVKHFFDFEDGYRLNITRDLVEGAEFILVTGGMVHGPLMPVTLIAARVVIHFAELTDSMYGQGEVVSTETGMVCISFKCPAEVSVAMH